MVGRVEMLRERNDLPPGKAHRLDLRALLYKETAPASEESTPATSNSLSSDSLHAGRLDSKLAKLAARALGLAVPYETALAIHNTDRAVGAILSNKISRAWRAAGLPEGCIRLHFRGCGRTRSSARFPPKGWTWPWKASPTTTSAKDFPAPAWLFGPTARPAYNPSDHIIIGNVALFGATSGEAYICGQAGERFTMRNSGALAVVEGIGDHGCEYMTGGRVVVLGETRRQFRGRNDRRHRLHLRPGRPVPAALQPYAHRPGPTDGG